MNKFSALAVIAATFVLVGCNNTTPSGQQTVDIGGIPEAPTSKIEKGYAKKSCTETCKDEGSRPVAKKERKAPAQQDASAVTKSGNEQAIRESSISRVIASAMNSAEEGRVYADQKGNTFERHTAGGRLCQFYVQGNIRKEIFVADGLKSSCDVEAQKYLATLQATSPSQAVAQPAAPAPTPAPATGATSDKNHTCSLYLSGKVVETTKTKDDAECKVWTAAQAKARGWTLQGKVES